jgi:hypothetical protein
MTSWKTMSKKRSEKKMKNQDSMDKAKKNLAPCPTALG